MKHINLGVPEVLLQKVDLAAWKSRMSRAEWVRTTLESAVDSSLPGWEEGSENYKLAEKYLGKDESGAFIPAGSHRPHAPGCTCLICKPPKEAK